jgi:hypothetical protein
MRRSATKYVHKDPAADCEGVVGLVFAKLASFFEEEEDSETGSQEKDGGHEIGESVGVFGHPVHSTFATEGRVRAENRGVAFYRVC